VFCLWRPGIKKSIDPYYDYFIDFESSHYSAMISRSVNSAVKFGFLIKGKKRGYNKYYKNRFDYKQQGNLHRVQAYGPGGFSRRKSGEDITPRI
jgi:ADP-heptose:LPS heptosyltransferase